MEEHYEEILLERGFTINKDGIVHNNEGNEIKGKLKGEYKAIAIRIDGKRVDVKFHRFQAYMKYGKKLYEKGIMVCHLNNNKLDNSWDNIAIGTAYDNMMDNPLEHRMKYAINASKKANKYKKDFVDEIRRKHVNGMTYEEIMKEYGIPKSSISYIINNDYKVH